MSLQFSNISFCTSNIRKIEEISSILGIKINHIDLDLEEIQGTSIEISTRKVQNAFNIVKTPVIIEDTSLCFNALNGLPGPYIKCF